MIPYFAQPAIHLGPITIYAFGLIVAGAFAVGLELGRRRVRAVALDARIGEGLAWWAVVGGFVGAHLFSVLFYFPAEVAANPWHLLKFWEDISSFGGIIGGLFAIALYLRYRARATSPAERWQYLDVAAYVFPVSLLIGRVACSLAHDHPGRITSFPLAISLRSLAAQSYIRGEFHGPGALPSSEVLSQFGFHDLGLYELLYLALFVVPITVWLGRRKRRPGFFLLLFITLYMPVRFGLDVLRVADARYMGLTPAQWAALGLLVCLPAVWRVSRRAAARMETASPDAAPFASLR